jgi:VanZ family protein
MAHHDEGASPLLRAACFGAVAALVFQLFYLGAQPMAGALFQPPWDAAAHFCVYSALTVLLWKASGGRMPVAVLATVILVGGLDELHQAGIPGRVADMADFLVDVGAAVFTGALMLLLETRGAGMAARPAER